MKSLKMKTLLMFLSLTLIFIAVIGYSLYSLKSTTNSYTDLMSRQASLRDSVQTVATKASNESLATRSLLLSNDKANIDSFNTAHDEIDDILTKARANMTIKKNIAIVDELLSLNTQFDEKFQQLVKMQQNGAKNAEMQQFWKNELHPVGEKMLKETQDFADGTANTLKEKSNENAKAAQTSFTLLVILMVITIIISVAIAIFFARFLTRPIEKLSQATKEVAAGNLAVKEVFIDSKDELAELAHSFNTMIHQLQKLVGNVSQSSTFVAASAQQLLASTEQSSKATQHITSSIQEVASGSRLQEEHITNNQQTLEEISTGVERVAHATNEVSSLSDEALKMTERGQISIDHVVEQMQQINHSTTDSASRIRLLNERSSEIANIVNVITEISDQTNLLALNAAIEAARAGEHGKGFAVVADEVRKLAEQSKQSADDIAALIQEIQQETQHAVTSMDQGTKDVAAGIEAVSVVGDGFTRINEAIQHITNEITDITNFAEEMAHSSNQIVDAMEKISRLSKNASDYSENVAVTSEKQLSTMEEINSASEDLAKRAEKLLADIQYFKLENA
ncbi:methyl-accepting chemotaxis protein [Kurthia massiliensis]|uniref:methyl-accepting chemotaxis protein n=1 Tax=Kurthia massiliensis TaxID=1033739 RepID=UPI0002897FB0|nr:methyl-accepting chemotaxis protein [Kurthia massiliensis]